MYLMSGRFRGCLLLSERILSYPKHMYYNIHPLDTVTLFEQVRVKMAYPGTVSFLRLFYLV